MLLWLLTEILWLLGLLENYLRAVSLCVWAMATNCSVFSKQTKVHLIWQICQKTKLTKKDGAVIISIWMLTTNAVARNASHDDGVTRLCLLKFSIGTARHCCLPVLTQVIRWLGPLRWVGIIRWFGIIWFGLNKARMAFLLAPKWAVVAIDIDFVTCRLKRVQQTKFRYELY